MVATIEFIESVIADYQAATQANLETPAREGNLVHLTSESAEEVMVTGDLHGHRRNFNSIRRIADLENHPRRHLVMQEVCHGGPTYPSNGGCMSHTLLEDVAKLKATYPDRLHFIMSNHEMAELTDYPIVKQRKMLNLLFRLGLQEAYGPATEKVREAYLPFLRSCPLGVRVADDILVCHSAPANFNPHAFDVTIFDRPLEAVDFREHGQLFNMLWGRDFSQENAAKYAKVTHSKVLIHGHEPCSSGFEAPNDIQIILDCCGEKASYVVLPTDRALSHQEIVERVEPLP